MALKSGSFYVWAARTVDEPHRYGRKSTPAHPQPALTDDPEEATWFRSEDECRRFCDSSGCCNLPKMVPVHQKLEDK